jgi:hypothetical protein
MSKKETLQQELSRRKYRQPNTFFYWFYKTVMVDFQIAKFNPKITMIDDIRKEKDGAFLLWNHLSRLDHAYIVKALYPKKFNMVAGYCEFFRSHLAWVFKKQQIIPKKNFCMDPVSVKAILSLIKQKGVVTMAPEGLASITGVNERVVGGIGHLLKHCHVPVYFARFDGEALVAPVFSSTYRYGGGSEVTVFRMFSPADLEKLSEEEIEERLMKEFFHDDYDYQEKNHFKWDSKGKACEGMEDICYKCPNCGAEFHMHSEGDDIHCDQCGFSYHTNEYLELIPSKKVDHDFKYPSKWTLWERKCVIDEIRQDPNYSFSFKTSIGTLPTDHYVKDKTRSSEVVGEGTFTLDHQGMHYVGTKDGKPFTLELSYKIYFRVIEEVNARMFSLYVDGEYYEFTPQDRVVGKVDFICSEMHRLHFNTWPCVPGHEYLYQ